MKKKIFACLIIALSLYSCNSQGDSISESVPDSSEVTSATSVSTTVSGTDSEAHNDIEKIENDKKESESKYDIKTDTIQAEDIYDCSYFTMPETINGYNYFISGINQNKLIVALSQSGQEEEHIDYQYGLYDLTNDSYCAVTDFMTDAFYLCSDERYWIFSSITDEVTSYIYYDTETQTSGTIINFVNDITQTADGPIINGNRIYFDVYKTIDDNTAIPMVYEYNSEDQSLNLIYENAMKPMCSEDNLRVITYNEENQKYDRIISVTNPAEECFQNKDKLFDISCSSGKIIGIVTDHGRTYSVKDLTSSQEILSTYEDNGDMLGNMAANDNFVCWYDITGENNTPCVYDTKYKKIVTFDNMSQCYYRTYIYDKYGLIFDQASGENFKICLFSIKGE
ncbi:MAG: hypothetical protein Q4F95_02390 [Oscillospiraceae bacterium]|nr:hypothetical protein [Oscillospiraceae bacterium]